jgi:hypothetical protein
MTERLQQPNDSGHRSRRRRTPRTRAGGLWGARAIPDLPPMEVAPPTGPTILGFPAEVSEGTDPGGPSAGGEAPDVLPLHRAPGVVKRVDRFGGGALVLAGVAANVSLLLSWSPGEGPTGLSLVQQSVEMLRSGVGEAVRNGVWQPFAVVLSGGLLVLLGLLLLVPARAHRLVGLLALIISLAAAAAVILLLADAGWTVDRVGPGLWCAVAVPVLGVLGSLKAMLAAPLVAVRPADQPPPTAAQASP